MEIQVIPLFAPTKSINYEKVITGKIALIDADRYKHLTTYRMFKKLTEEGQLHCTSLLNETIDDYLSNHIFNRFEATQYVFCFSAPSNKVFRNAITQEKKYKGNREGKVDNYFYSNKWDDMAYVYKYINSRYQTLFYDDLEADDLVSMIQTEDTFIFSNDKDLRQVKGWHWSDEDNKLVYTTEGEGLRALSFQLLTGDTVDNIPGVKGFGPAALEKFKEKALVEGLDQNGILKAVIDVYVDKYGLLKGYDTFVEMWNLLCMKLDRGEYFREKYSKAFNLIAELTNEKT